MYRVVEYGKTYNVEVFFPRLQVEGTYDVNGQILLLPIKGQGPFTGNFSKILSQIDHFRNLKNHANKIDFLFFLVLASCTGNVRLQFSRKENSELVQNKKFAIKIKVAKGSIKLYNLFNGDRALGKIIFVKKNLKISKTTLIFGYL